MWTADPTPTTSETSLDIEMMAPASYLLSAAILLQFTSASPLSLYQRVDECSLNIDDPSSWSQSLASLYMEKWFAINTTNDWLHAMDSTTTTIPGFSSLLDCLPLGGTTCIAPEPPCKDFTPPELHLIRVAAVRAHDFFTSAHELLQNTVISDFLSIDQIINDFAPRPSDDFAWTAPAAAGFGIGSAAVGATGPVGAVLGSIFGVIGGTFGLIRATNPAPVYSRDDLNAAVENQLKDAFLSAEQNIVDLNSQLFGGPGDLDLKNFVDIFVNSGLITSDQAASLDPITAIFSTGAFLARPSASNLNDMLRIGFDRVKQSLVAGTLRANNYFVMIDTTSNGQATCGSTKGSRTIGDECMIISKRNGQYPYDTIPVEKEILLNLDDSQKGYNIDPAVLYQNAIDCDGGRLETDVSLDGNLPKCFYSLPIVRVEGSSACLLVEHDMASAKGTPAGLRLTRKSCFGS